MKRIVLLRHGESLWNRENRFTGWTDVDLVRDYFLGDADRIARSMAAVAAQGKTE